jgi:ATP-binding protein involved in chromosome partitioning
MTDIIRDHILNAFKKIKHPATGINLIESDMIEGLIIKGSKVGFAIKVEPHEAKLMEEVRKSADKAVLQVTGVEKVTSVLTAEKQAGSPSPTQSPSSPAGHPATAAPPTMDRTPKPRIGGHGTKPPEMPQPIAGVKNVIAVASGKGGVGKSTTAVNLALALSKLGLKAGIFDIDIYGPSIPTMLGIDEKPELLENKQITPLKNHGVVCMSIGFLLEKDMATIWRGPMVMGAIQQMLGDVKWDLYSPLDVLIVDLPPGTGDAQLTLVQNVKIDGAIIVSTPQDIALIDAKRGINMFERTDTKIMGIIENMSYFSCPSCGERAEIFSNGGVKETAKSMKVDFLGEIPLHMDIRIGADRGEPIVVSKPSGEHSKIYLEIAGKIIKKLN